MGCELLPWARGQRCRLAASILVGSAVAASILLRTKGGPTFGEVSVQAVALGQSG